MVERIVNTFNKVLPRHLDTGVFVLGPDFGDAVRAQLTEICERHGMTSEFAVQATALGTGHAVLAAGDALSGEGIVVFADTLFEMEPGVKLDEADVVAWVKHVEDPSRFGVAVREGGRVVALVEKPQELISTEALIGIYYVRDLAALREANQYLMDNEITGHGEYQLTDAMDRLLQAGRVFATATVTEWLDCGTIPALLDTTKIILSKEGNGHPEGAVEGSVIIDPVYFGAGARVTNSVVGPNVSLEAGAEVSGSVVRDSILFSGARVEGSILKDSLIGRDAVVALGPQKLNIGDHSYMG